MAYYENIIAGLDFNDRYNAYSGTLNDCYIDIVADGDGWSCEILIDGVTNQNWGSTPASALKNTIE